MSEQSFASQLQWACKRAQTRLYTAPSTAAQTQREPELISGLNLLFFVFCIRMLVLSYAQTEPEVFPWGLVEHKLELNQVIYGFDSTESKLLGLIFLHAICSFCPEHL